VREYTSAVRWESASVCVCVCVCVCAKPDRFHNPLAHRSVEAEHWLVASANQILHHMANLPCSGLSSQDFPQCATVTTCSVNSGPILLSQNPRGGVVRFTHCLLLRSMQTATSADAAARPLECARSKTRMCTSFRSAALRDLMRVDAALTAQPHEGAHQLAHAPQ
jgi:hypothetical protein